MSSRPLHIAFIALTCSLVVSLSLWVVHSSHEQVLRNRAVTLQMPSIPAEINSDEVRKNLSSDLVVAEVLPEPEPDMVELERPPVLEGIEASPVSQDSSASEPAPAFPDSPEDEAPPEISFDPIPTTSQPAEEPLELPELDLRETDEDETPEFPELDPAGPVPSDLEPTAPPLVELIPEPLSAPRPPAWLSRQAVLEAQIEELKHQQKKLAESLSDREPLVEEWVEMQSLWSRQRKDWARERQAWDEERKSWDAEKRALTQQLSDARDQISDARNQIEALTQQQQNDKQEAVKYRQQVEQLNHLLDESDEINSELKKTLRQKQSTIGELENDARRMRYELEQLRSGRRAVPERSDSSMLRDDRNRPPVGREPALLPPLPAESGQSEQGGFVSEESVISRSVEQAVPVVPAEQPVRQSNRTPLIPAEVPVNGAPSGSVCTTCEARPMEKKGLIYDLKDWYRGWKDSGDSACTCDAICIGKRSSCTETGESVNGRCSLLPDFTGWMKHPLAEWD